LNKKNKNGGKSSSSSASKSSSSAKGGTSPMDVSLLERIVKLMAANDLSAVDVRDGDKRVILKRGPQFVAGSGSSGYSMPQMMSAPSAPPASASLSSGLASGATSGGADDEAGFTPIKSPMVGTFYSAPSPDAKPFVSVGSRVDEETDVCVIEAMKVFNNIKAETHGSIAKVLVSNGETVEFGQVLFLVKP
jgi:acetyl-CoA carboxylase biotin carboxyl carrier protein